MRKKKQDRIYRSRTSSEGLKTFRVAVKETDIFVSAGKKLADEARELVLKHRGHIENYIDMHPDFAKTLCPINVNGPVPGIVRDMFSGAIKSGVGPMAAVAGAIAERVGHGLLSYTEQVIVENGGDIFIKTDFPATVGLFAGKSILSGRIGLKIDSAKAPISVCTSSGVVGHSMSMGKADAVCVVSGSCSLADAAATSIGNLVKKKTDIQKALDFGKKIPGLFGILIILDDKAGIWGEIDIVGLDG